MEVGNSVHGADNQGRIQIDEIVYESILTCIGYPLVSPSDIKLTDDQVKRLYIREAMEDFWIRFPMEETVEYSATGPFDIPFPDANTFGVVDCRVNNQIYDGVRTASPFFNALSATNRTLDYNLFGSGYDYGMRSTQPGKMAEIAGQIEFMKSIKTTVSNRRLTGYSNVSGNLHVVWAKKSYNWNDIPFNFQQDVEKLAQAKILYGFAMLVKQAAMVGVPVELDGDAFYDRAEKLEEYVLDRWNDYTKIAILR